MNTYQKVIYLYFKKDFSITEIAEFLSEELAEFREVRANGRMKPTAPLQAVHTIIGNEIATHYHLGQLDEYRSLRQLVMKTETPRVKKELVIKAS